MEADLPVFVRKRPSRGEAGLRAGADVLEPGESIDELAADQVRIAVAVEIGDTRIGRPVNVDRGACGLHLAAVDISPAGVFQQVDVAVQRTPGPASETVESVVPAVVVPRVDAHDDVLVAVAVPVGVAPHIAPRLVVGGSEFLAFVVQAAFFGIGGLEEVGVFEILRKDVGFAVRLRETDVVHPLLADALGGGETGMARRTDVFEEIESFVGAVGARHQQVFQTVAVVVHGQRNAPQPDSQIDREARIVIAQDVRVGLGRGISPPLLGIGCMRRSGRCRCRDEECGGQRCGADGEDARFVKMGCRVHGFMSVFCKSF